MTTLRHLPSIDALLRATVDLQAQYGRERTVEVLRRVVDAARQAVLDGGAIPPEFAIIAQATALLEDDSRPTLRLVINATGVIIHTNLGRAPLSGAALRAMQEVAGGYSTLEYELEPGARGQRDRHAQGC